VPGFLRGPFFFSIHDFPSNREQLFRALFCPKLPVLIHHLLQPQLRRSLPDSRIPDIPKPVNFVLLVPGVLRVSF
jgi:hypothetical protein